MSGRNNATDQRIREINHQLAALLERDSKVERLIDINRKLVDTNRRLIREKDTLMHILGSSGVPRELQRANEFMAEPR